MPNYDRTAMVLSVAGVLVAGAAHSAPISRGNMPAYCRGEVSGMYGARPQYVKTGKIVKAKGGYSISGTVDKGNDWIKKFMCRFDRNRSFIDVMAMVSKGYVRSAEPPVRA